MHADLLETTYHFTACCLLLVLIGLHEEPNSVAEIKIYLAGDEDQIQKLVMLKIAKIAFE